MQVDLYRCSYCAHIRDEVNGKFACDAFPDGYDKGPRDIPGKGCANGLQFEVASDKNEAFKKNFLYDNWYTGPYEKDIIECYNNFIESGIPLRMKINQKEFYRVIGKFKRTYDDKVATVLLIPLEVFYSGSYQQTVLIDDAKNLIEIKDRGPYTPQIGLHNRRWEAFSCIVEVTNNVKEHQIGNYIRLLKVDELVNTKKEDAAV